MDIENRIKEIAVSPRNIHKEFYDEKVKTLLAQQKQDPNIKELQLNSITVIETIKEHFPEATITERPYSYYRLLIKLKNADFLIQGLRAYKIIELKKNNYLPFVPEYIFTSAHISTIPNFIEYMKEIDRLMPEWEKEFANMIAAHDNVIIDKQRNWVLKGKRSVDNILEYRIELFLLECRPTPNQTGNMSFENFHIKIYYTQILIVVPNHCTVAFPNNGIDIEHFRQLDKLIPIWIDELYELNLEYKKLEKSKEVGELSVTALVKKKMKALGCEYYIKRNFKSMSLYIKVDQQCMRKFFLPYNDIGLIRRRLDSIDDTFKGKIIYYNAFRMKLMEQRLKWTREIVEEKDE